MLLIRQGHVIDPSSKRNKITDILIKDGKIIKMASRITVEDAKEIEQEALEVIDAEGYIVAPGLVDVHVHFRDPGFTYKEDIISGGKAAAKGGFTTVVLMANTKPVGDNEETLTYILKKGKTTGIHVETCGTITKGLGGTELTDMEALLKAGAVGFTDDGIPMLDAHLVEASMELAKKLQVPLSFHEENPAFIKNNGINSNIAKQKLGIEGSPREAEIDLVQRDLQIALKVGAIVNVQHISSKEAVELVRQAKRQSNLIHAEATPHHFTLTEDAVIEYGTLAKMNPPLRTNEDRLAIIEGLKDGTIDIIATDHAPHSIEEKEKKLEEAPSGIIGLETALSLGITNLVDMNYLTMSELLEKMTWNPAQMYQLDAGYLKEEGPADLVIFDPNGTYIVDKFQSKSCNTPFIGKALQGIVKYTICEGMIVYQSEMAD